MILCFELSMPNAGSWDGKWSGADNYYAVTRGVTKKQAMEVLAKPYHHYNFGDGWGAAVDVSEVTGAEAQKIRRRSQGFCGYEWMVTSIIENGTIIPRVP